MSTHATVRVRSPWGWAKIDRALAGLVRAIWKLGLETGGCCENAGETNYDAEYHAGEASISFDSHEDACRWLVVVRDHVPSYGKTWSIYGEPWWRKDGSLNVAAIVHFPRWQIADLERATRKAAKGRKMPVGPRSFAPGVGPVQAEWWELHDRPHDDAFRAKRDALIERIAMAEVASEEMKRTSPTKERDDRAPRKHRRAKGEASTHDRRENDARAHGLADVEAAPTGPAATGEPDAIGQNSAADVSSRDTSNGAANASVKGAAAATNRAQPRAASREPSTSARTDGERSTSPAPDFESSQRPRETRAIEGDRSPGKALTGRPRSPRKGGR